MITAPVIESEEIPKDMREFLCQYYAENDHRPIPNDSYSRYPMGCDIGDGLENDYYNFNNFDEWLVNYLGIIPSFIIIHWDW